MGDLSVQALKDETVQELDAAAREEAMANKRTGRARAYAERPVERIPGPLPLVVPLEDHQDAHGRHHPLGIGRRWH